MAGVLRQQGWTQPRPSPSRPSGDEGMMGAFARMAELVGVPPTRLMRDFAGLSFGPGRVSIGDYERLRLYDDAFWAGADRRTVVGARRGREIALQVNFRHEWLGLTENRLVWGAYLAAHGLPVIPTLAIYTEGLATPSRQLLRTREELRAFLAEQPDCPLVGRPAEGGHATAIVGRAASAIDHLVDDICDHHGAGYLFQPLIAPDARIAPLTEGRLAAVRLVTVAGDHGPRVARALWRTSAAADAVVPIDLRSGQITRVSARSPMSGVRMPDWEALKAAAVETARLLRHLPMLGFDVAPSESGPVIVGLSATPDLALHQLADRRGLLELDFVQFLESQRRLAAEHAEQAKADAAWS
jgi:hypothetical protein